MSRRIVFVNRFFNPDHSATSQMLSDLAFFLAGRGHEVLVITSRQRYDAPDARLATEEHLNGIAVHRVWTSRFGRGVLPGRAIDYLTFFLSTAWRLLRLGRAGDVVVAKTDPPLISVVAGWVARWRGARLVNWLQDLLPEVAAALGIGLKSGAVADLLSRLRDCSLRKTSMNVALGDGMRRRLIDLGVDQGTVCMFHNWSDDERIRPLPAELNPLRKEWGLAGKGSAFGVGRALARPRGRRLPARPGRTEVRPTGAMRAGRCSPALLGHAVRGTGSRHPAGTTAVVRRVGPEFLRGGHHLRLAAGSCRDDGGFVMPVPCPSPMRGAVRDGCAADRSALDADPRRAMDMERLWRSLGHSSLPQIRETAWRSHGARGR